MCPRCEGLQDRTSYARYNGREAISIEVTKRADANVMADSVQQSTGAGGRGEASQIPAGIEVIVSQNQAGFAAPQVSELEGNIVTALALVMVLVVATMGFRSGVIVGPSIPGVPAVRGDRYLPAGLYLQFHGDVRHAAGTVLIDSIISSRARHAMADGMHHRAAYAEAVRRMFWPVTASTATTLAAFLPLIFWPGVSGKFMAYLPVTGVYRAHRLAAAMRCYSARCWARCSAGRLPTGARSRR